MASSPQSSNSQRTSSSSSSSSGRRIRWRWVILGLIVLGLVLAPLTAVGVGVHMENNQTFCAGCHTQPETEYVQRAQASNPADLASFHAQAEQPVACIQCHSGKGIKGRITALQLGAHDLLAFASRNYTQPAKLTHAIADENCLKCHPDIAQAQTFENHFHALLGRWQQIRPDTAASCVDCHTSHATNGDPRIAFLNEQHTVAQCNQCHRLLGDD